MTAHALLAELNRRGVTARVVGDRLRLAPAAAVDEGLLAEARRLKPELLRLLTNRGQVVTPAVCGWCNAALEPYLIDLVGWPALLCTSCKRWTYAGGAV
ncbi:MAG: hypothetical protein LAO05_06180 [Acidobacteriia bacterium]|nr:hypothetical protein [Terriglobia bacterium]